MKFVIEKKMSHFVYNFKQFSVRNRVSFMA